MMIPANVTCYLRNAGVSEMFLQCLDGPKLRGIEGGNIVLALVGLQVFERHVARSAVVQFLAAGLEIGLVGIAVTDDIDVVDVAFSPFIGVMLPVVHRHLHAGQVGEVIIVLAG